MIRTIGVVLALIYIVWNAGVFLSIIGFNGIRNVFAIVGLFITIRYVGRKIGRLLREVRK